MSKYTKNTIKKNMISSWNTIISLIKENSEVLDVGCSSGYLAKELSKKKRCKVWGVDIAEEDIELARKNCVEAYTHDVDDPEWTKYFSKQKFDYLIFADILEHLRNPYAVLLNARKLIKPAGRLIISVPNIAHTSIRLSLLLGRFESQHGGIMDDTHLQYFTKKKISEIVQKTGFEIEKISPVILEQIPKKIISDYLKKLGLEINDKAMKEFQSEEANAYQYVVIAKKTNRQSGQLNHKEKIKIQIDTDNYLKKLNNALLITKKELYLLKKQLKEYDKNIKYRDKVLLQKKKIIREYDKNIRYRDSLLKDTACKIKEYDKNVRYRDKLIANLKKELAEYDRNLKICIKQRDEAKLTLENLYKKYIVRFLKRFNLI